MPAWRVSQTIVTRLCAGTAHEMARGGRQCRNRTQGDGPTRTLTEVDVLQELARLGQRHCAFDSLLDKRPRLLLPCRLGMAPTALAVHRRGCSAGRSSRRPHNSHYTLDQTAGTTKNRRAPRVQLRMGPRPAEHFGGPGPLRGVCPSPSAGRWGMIGGREPSPRGGPPGTPCLILSQQPSRYTSLRSSLPLIRHTQNMFIHFAG